MVSVSTTSIIRRDNCHDYDSAMFAEVHYKITINISKTNESVSHGGEVGMFVVHVIGSNGKKTEKMRLSSTSKYYEPGSTHTLVVPGNVVSKPQSAEITWEYQTSVFNPLTWRLFHKPLVYIDSLTVSNLETDHRYLFSSSESVKMFPIKSVKLIRGNIRGFLNKTLLLCCPYFSLIFVRKSKILQIHCALW